MDDDCFWYRRSAQALMLGRDMDVKRYDNWLAISYGPSVERLVKILTCAKVVYSIQFPQYKRQASRVLKTGRPIGSHVCPKEGTPSHTQRVLVSKPFQYKKTVYICTSNMLRGCKWGCTIRIYFKMNIYWRSDQVHNYLVKLENVWSTWIKGMLVDSLSDVFGSNYPSLSWQKCTCAGRVKVMILPVGGYMLQAPTWPDSLLPQMRWFDI